MVLGLEVLENLGECEKVGEPVGLQEGGEGAPQQQQQQQQQDRKPPVQRQQQQQQGANANTFYGNQNQPKPGVAPPSARSAPKL